MGEIHLGYRMIHCCEETPEHPEISVRVEMEDM